MIHFNRVFGFSIIFTIHFGGFPPIFGNTHMCLWKNTCLFWLHHLPHLESAYLPATAQALMVALSTPGSTASASDPAASEAKAKAICHAKASVHFFGLIFWEGRTLLEPFFLFGGEEMPVVKGGVGGRLIVWAEKVWIASSPSNSDQVRSEVLDCVGSTPNPGYEWQDEGL